MQYVTEGKQGRMCNRKVPPRGNNITPAVLTVRPFLGLWLVFREPFWVVFFFSFFCF